jgi:hypothetical protein
MDRQPADQTYVEPSYQNGRMESMQKSNAFTTGANARKGPTNIRKQSIKNKQILMHNNLVNQNYNSIDYSKYSFGTKKPSHRHSVDFDANPPYNAMASLKEKLRKNANTKKWKGRREKVFANSSDKDKPQPSPENYTFVNNRYMKPISNLMRTRTNERNLKIVSLALLLVTITLKL